MTAPRDYSVYLAHLRDAIDRVAAYLEGVTEDALFGNSLLQDGVTRQLEIVGEAAKHLSAAAARGAFGADPGLLATSAYVLGAFVALLESSGR